MKVLPDDVGAETIRLSGPKRPYFLTAIACTGNNDFRPDFSQTSMMVDEIPYRMRSLVFMIVFSFSV